MPRMYTKTQHYWPNHADTFELAKRNMQTGDFERMVLADDQQPIIDALLGEISEEMPGAQAALDGDWDGLSHAEQWTEGH